MRRWARWTAFGVIMTAAVAFLLIGVAQGQPNTVLQKAIRICLECIGIG